MARRDSLEPLQQQREHQKAQQALALAKATRRAEQAASEHQRAKLAREAQQQQLDTQQQSERQRLGDGRASAADLAQQAQFEARARSVVDTLSQNERQEADELALALQERRQQQSILSETVAQADAVAQHRSRLLAAERHKKEEQEGETAEEQWLAQHLRAGKR